MKQMKEYTDLHVYDTLSPSNERLVHVSQSKWVSNILEIFIGVKIILSCLVVECRSAALKAWGSSPQVESPRIFNIVIHQQKLSA